MDLFVVREINMKRTELFHSVTCKWHLINYIYCMCNKPIASFWEHSKIILIYKMGNATMKMLFETKIVIFHLYIEYAETVTL